MKLIIGIPTIGSNVTGFSYSLAGMISYLAAKGLPSRPEEAVELSMDVQESSVIHANREAIVQRALERKATHLLFLDNDLVFEPNIIDVLAGRRQAMVVTNYRIKCDGVEFVAVGKDGQRVPTTEASTGLLPITYSGFGVSLFDLEKTFAKTPQPWFMPIWNAETKSYSTEDLPCFQRICEATGETVYLDQDASKLVTGHVGLFGWSWKDPVRVDQTRQ